MQRDGRTCKRRPYISSHSRGTEKIPRTMVSLNKSGKNGPMKLRSDFRAAVSMKNSPHHESGEQVINTVDGDGIPLQAYRGGTSLNGIGNVLIRFFKKIDLLFVAVGFVYSRLRSTVTDAVRISLHPHAIHDVTCFERAFVVSSCLSLSCFSPTSTFSLSQSTCSLSGTPSSMSSPPRVKTTGLTHNEEYCSMAIYHPLTPRDQPEADLITEEIDCKSLPSAHEPGSSLDPRTCKSQTCHWW